MKYYKNICSIFFIIYKITLNLKSLSTLNQNKIFKYFYVLQYVSVILLLRVIRALVILRVILIKRNAITSSALSLFRSSSADNSLRLFTSHIMQYVHQKHNK